MPEVDLGKVRMTESELSNFILQFNGGLKIGKMEDGSPGYYKEDEETGEEVLSPFKSGGGGGLEGVVEQLHYYSTTTLNYVNLSFEKDYKIIFAIVGRYNTSTTYPTVNLKLPNPTFEQEIRRAVSTYRVTEQIAFEIGDFKQGDTYYVSWSGGTGTFSSIYIFGIY